MFLVDVKSTSTLVQLSGSLKRLEKHANDLIAQHPNYELDVLKEFKDTVGKLVAKALEIGEGFAEPLDKHSFFKEVCNDIETIGNSFVGYNGDTLLGADTMEEIWNAIPEDLDCKIIVVRIFVPRK